jgi:hypothetical protein
LATLGLVRPSAGGSEPDAEKTQEPIVQTTSWASGAQRTGIIALVLVLWAVQPLVVAGQETDVPLQGEFAVTIAAEDVPPELIEGASLIGRWHITFHADGAYQLGRQDVGPVVSGQFETGGNRLTLLGETGVLACPADEDDDALPTYEWEIADGQLRLVAIEEPCDRRRLLFTTRTLSSFAACPSQTPVSAAQASGSPVVESTSQLSSDTVVASPEPQSAPDTAIDLLLRQMSDCWATRQPDRFLQLLSRDFQASQRPDGADAARRFTLAMGAPLSWHLAGEVEMVDATHAAASVRQIAGDDIDVVRYNFVFEDGAWRWDGTFDSP